MNGLPGVILGGDPFCNAFRALYDQRCYWRLTNPDYCLDVMRAAYRGGCRSFDYSFGEVQNIYLRLCEEAEEPISGIGNLTWLQGPKLYGQHLQYCRDRLLKTIVEHCLPKEDAELVRGELRVKTPMVFGYDESAEAYTQADVDAITLDEEVFLARMAELHVAENYLIGGTDADWLFALGRTDIIARMAALVRKAGKTPLLLCHYASLVLPRADEIELDVEGYLAPINHTWAWFSSAAGVQAVQNAKKPVLAFMAFACGGLSANLAEAARYLREDCGVSGILYGTTKPPNAEATARLIQEIFGE